MSPLSLLPVNQMKGRLVEDFRGPSQLELPAYVRESLIFLLDSYRYTCTAGDDRWRFAIEWRLLASHHLTPNDVRWLISKELIEVKQEVSLPGAFRRRFVDFDVPRLTRDAAIVLTDAGADFCATILPLPAPENSAANGRPRPVRSDPSGAIAASKPVWKKAHREFSLDGKTIKAFRVPAFNQERILDAFEEEAWPEFIDDPLPPVKDIHPDERLRSAVKSLNRNQVNKLIHFRVNGSSRVFWTARTG